MKLWLSLGILAILAICTWSGYKKGLVMGIGGVLAVVVAIYAANLLSSTFSYEVIPAMAPFASGYMEKKMNEDVSEALAIDESGLSIEDFLLENPELQNEFAVRTYKALGIYETSAQAMADMAEQRALRQGQSLTKAMIDVFCEQLAYIAGFCLAFVMVLIVLTVLGNIPNLSFKIPNMDILNDVGGTVLGLVTGFMLCTVFVWSLKFLGLVLKPENITGSWLPAALLKADPLMKILGI